MSHFIADLDEYFCEKYASYDKISILPDYKMPLMQGSKIDEFGRTITYTLPSENLRLAKQEKKDKLLAELKTRLTDLTFSFSFQPIGCFARLKNRLSKYAFYKNLKTVLEKYDFTDADAMESLRVSEEIWKGIRKNKFLPTKNLLLSLALAAHISFEDTTALCNLCGYEFDFAVVKDVVIAYLLQHRVYNREMVAEALNEYSVANLFLK